MLHLFLQPWCGHAAFHSLDRRNRFTSTGPRFTNSSLSALVVMLDSCANGPDGILVFSAMLFTMVSVTRRPRTRTFCRQARPHVVEPHFDDMKRVVWGKTKCTAFGIEDFSIESYSFASRHRDNLLLPQHPCPQTFLWLS